MALESFTTAAFIHMYPVYDAAAATYDNDAGAAAFGGDERWAQGDTVPPDPRSLAQPPPPGSVPSACVLVSPLYMNRP